MKKLKLKQTNFANGDVLNRAQLKKIMGGYGSGSSPTGCVVYSITSDGLGNTTRTMVEEIDLGPNQTEIAGLAAEYYVQNNGGQYGYDCPDSNGNYQHTYS